MLLIIVLASSQGPRHTKDVIKMVPVVPLFSTEHSKGKMLALSQELKSGIENPSLVVVAGMKKRMTTQNRQKSKSNAKKKLLIIEFFMQIGLISLKTMSLTQK